MMTYIELLNRFWHANKTERFSIGERELYYYLLNECNKNYWYMPVSCPTSVICTVTGLNKQTLMRARDNLKKRGLIDYTEGIQNSKAPTYIIIMDKDEFVTANVTGCVTATKTASVTSNKDKDNIITDKSRLNDFLSIDELERKLTEDTVWQNHILSYLSNSGTTIDVSILQKFLQDFFSYLRICGYDRREEKECRSHFFNKLTKEYLNSQKHKRYDNKQSNNDKRRGIEVKDVTPRDYYTSF
ncbi:hypothetical protein [uncultured Bacteroides sp.]|jgi:hypothetical protein|nr:hypothetical protein [uncultured Bacteroides sp.]